jgi:hypothetical protein
VWTATKLLQIHPYKITVAPEIKHADYEKRVRFYNWFISHVDDGLFDPKLTFFTDEANLISWDMSTHKTKGTEISKILIP